MKFRLIPYFSIAAAAIVIFIGIVLWNFYSSRAESQMVSTIENNNIILATLLAKEIRGLVPKHFDVPHTPDTLKTSDHQHHTSQVTEKFTQVLRGSPILAVDVYFNDLTIYSSKNDTIGTTTNSAGFLFTQKNGTPFSKLVFKKSIDSFEGKILNRNVVETYVPIVLPKLPTPSGATLIIEVYTDVTTLVAEIKRTNNVLLAGGILGFVTLYIALLIIVRYAERKTLRSENRFLTLVEESNQGILVHRNGTPLFVNKALVKMYGYNSSEEIYALPSSNTLTDPEMLLANNNESRLDSKTGNATRQVQGVRKDGTKIWEERQSFPIEWSGEPASCSIRFDITGRKKAEDAQRDSEATMAHERRMLQDAVESFTDGFALFDSAEKFVLANERFINSVPNFGDIFKPGRTHEEITRLRVSTGSIRSEIVRDEQWVQKRLNDFRDGNTIERKFFDGRDMEFRHLKTPNGGTAMVLTDITKLKEIETALRESTLVAGQANQAKSEFLSSMSHELRTPLNAILGFSQLLETNPDSPLSDEQSISVGHIRKGGRHLLSLIDAVLDLAKIEAGKLEISIEDIAVEQVYDECLPLIQVRAEERHIQISKVSSLNENFSVRADHTALKQILLNLLSNAVKYNRVHGKISVEFVQSSDEMLKISITDTGEGIAEDLQSELFQPFSRLGQETTNIEGTGIGLVVTKRLVEAMGGKIGFKSEIDFGSTFWVELPQAQEISVSNEVANNLSTTLDHKELSGKVLYIEDNPANLDLMEMIISRIDGLDMVFAHTAELGLDFARVENPDVIIMDINLPKMNGFEALKELRKFSVTRETPVIALSANATDKDIEAGRKAGFQDYLTKPVDIGAVVQAIKAVIKE